VDSCRAIEPEIEPATDRARARKQMPDKEQKVQKEETHSCRPIVDDDSKALILAA
jgi:hypothetical protein